jgi:hypothetical protein
LTLAERFRGGVKEMRFYDDSMIKAMFSELLSWIRQNRLKMRKGDW